ncbi:hypothetical protein FoTM2_017521 [Fusarium oxysporum f. sp. vasinfectum]|nr:hypothetical protein FoTM2_017521 [Fusarium oxysporum f. sp. vasinfectum]
MAPPVLEHSPMSNLIVANRLDESAGRAARTSELLTVQHQLVRAWIAALVCHGNHDFHKLIMGTTRAKVQSLRAQNNAKNYTSNGYDTF